MTEIIQKISAINDDVSLYPHQKDTIEFVRKNRKAIIAHGTGMGKTLTSIAAFERLRGDGLASKAIVVVPASLRKNYANNIEKYTDSKYTIYGPKGDKNSLYIDVPSDAPYNIVSYDMYRKDPDGIKKRLRADTLIIDESHRARNKGTSTYKQMAASSSGYSNVLSLTGSLVNNEPSDIVSLMDISHGSAHNPIHSKADFNKRFVGVKKKNYFDKGSPTITHKRELGNILKDKVHYISHNDIKGSLPAVQENVIKVEMSPMQKKLYLYAINSLDPVTRRKIEKNVPVSQKEMAGIFAYMVKGRKVLTDPGAMYTKFDGQNPYDYSPKVHRVVDDLTQHLGASDKRKAVIYGNLVNSQLGAVEKALKAKGIQYGTFYGTGNKGNNDIERQQALKNYIDGKSRVLLVSGAGAEGLDLKGSTMLQMLEGHFNPEKIQQASARVRRMGDHPDEPILINKYVSVMPNTTMTKLLSFIGKKQRTALDEYIYTVAKRKDDLNEEFRSAIPIREYNDII